MREGISYETMKKIKKLPMVLTPYVFLSPTNLLLSQELSAGRLGVFIGATVLNLIAFAIPDTVYYFSKDIKEINKIYEEMLNEYIKLQKTFRFENPIEMSTMFYFTYRNGYLSAEHKYEFTECETFDSLYHIKGMNIINGIGVCRHISAMFSDILDTLGIDNKILSVNLSEDIEQKKSFYSNHAINLINYEGEYYFLDPTNINVYKLSNEILMSGRGYCTFSLTNPIPENIKGLEQNPDEIFENYKMQNKTLKICSYNADCFEKFYNENKDKYTEISNKIKTLKLK